MPTNGKLVTDVIYGDRGVPNGGILAECHRTANGFRPTMSSMLANNKMQQTRSGHSRWRPSLLILVLYRREIYEERLRIMRSHALHDH